MLDVVLQLFLEFVAGGVTFGENYRRFDHRSSDGVGRARDCALEHRGVFHKSGFHLERSDAVAAGLYDVVLSSHEPVHSVGVAFRKVAGVVEFAPACGGGAFGVVLVVGHQTNLMRAQSDGDFALAAVGHGVFLVIDKHDVVKGAGFAGATADGLHKAEVREDDAGFRLPEPLVNLLSRGVLELLEDFGVERLARSRAMAERREVVFRQVFLDEEAVNRRRHAESIDAVSGNEREQVGGGESAVIVVGENGAARYPLTVDFAPTAFCPARFGGGEVQTVVDDSLPEIGVEHETYGIFEVVLHHFGHTRCARSEIAQHIAARVGTVDCGVLVGEFHYAVLEATEAFHGCGVNTFAESFAFLEGVSNVLDDVGFGSGDEHLDARGIAAVCDVLGGEQVGGGNKYGAEFAAGDRQHPVFPATVEHTHNVIAAVDAGIEQETYRPVCENGEFSESYRLFFACRVAPYERALFGAEASVFVHDVAGEIEVFGNGDSDVLREVFIVTEIRTVDEFRQ